MQRRTLTLVVTVLFTYTTSLANQTSGFDVSSLHPDGRKAYQQLLHAAIFSIGPAGYVPSQSESERALRLLLNEKEAIAIFRDIVATAKTLQGRAYALMGLYLKDRTVFKQEIEQYKAVRETGGVLTTQSGCIVMLENEDTVLTKIETGQYYLLFSLSAGMN